MENLFNVLNTIKVLQATPDAPADMSQGSGFLGMIITLAAPLLMIGLMWLLLIRPQRKEEKKRAAERDAMKVGDKIVTIGGIVGKVVNIKDDEVTISTSVANTMMTFKKNAIDQVQKPISDEI